MTPREIRARLRDLLNGERTPADAAEAAQLLSEIESEVRPRRVETPAVDEATEERRRWAKVVRASGAPRRVWSPAPPMGHTKALLRDRFRPWG